MTTIWTNRLKKKTKNVCGGIFPSLFSYFWWLKYCVWFKYRHDPTTNIMGRKANTADSVERLSVSGKT